LPDWFDASLYPDIEQPRPPASLGERIDFVARLCGAWDFGLLPEADAVRELRRPAWRQATEACRMLTSPAYHLLREWHGLPPLPFLGSVPAYIRDDPNLERI
jgi:hypothetical protein